MKTLRLAGMLGVLVLASGCSDQGNERLAEKAGIEGGAQAQAALEVERKRAQEMESDLAIRQRVYQAVKGTYEGALRTEQGEFRIRITLVPSLPAYDPGRVRTLEEIAADLTSLYLSAQVVQWNPANNLSAVGCRIEGIRPDLVLGEINIASEGCPNFYSLIIGDEEQSDDFSKEEKRRMSGKLVEDLRSGAAISVGTLEGEMRPTTNAAIYLFKARKVSR